MYEMIVEMEGLSVEILILGKHCAQLLCHSNGTAADAAEQLPSFKCGRRSIDYGSGGFYGCDVLILAFLLTS